MANKHFLLILTKKIWIILLMVLAGGGIAAYSAVMVASPTVLIRTVIGVLAGAILGLGCIYLISLSDKTVCTVEDIVKNEKELKVIGIIPEHSIE